MAGGWALGAGLEAAWPYAMLAGGHGVFWDGFAKGVGAAAAKAEAAAEGAAMIHSTFAGSALAAAGKLGITGPGMQRLWGFFSSNFANSAGSATTLVGPTGLGGTFVTTELPQLMANGVIPAMKYLP
jgi:hypothetical protein